MRVRRRSGRLAAALALTAAAAVAVPGAAAARPPGNGGYGDPSRLTYLRPAVSEATVGERNNLIYQATVTNHSPVTATGIKVLRTTMECPPDRPLGRLKQCTPLASDEQAMPALKPGGTARFPLDVDLPGAHKTLVRTTVELTHVDQFDLGHFPPGCTWYGELWPGCAVRVTPLSG